MYSMITIEAIHFPNTKIFPNLKYYARKHKKITRC